MTTDADLPTIMMIEVVFILQAEFLFARRTACGLFFIYFIDQISSEQDLRS